MYTYCQRQTWCVNERSAHTRHITDVGTHVVLYAQTTRDIDIIREASIVNSDGVWNRPLLIKAALCFMRALATRSTAIMGIRANNKSRTVQRRTSGMSSLSTVTSSKSKLSSVYPVKMEISSTIIGVPKLHTDTSSSAPHVRTSGHTASARTYYNVTASASPQSSP